MAKIILNNEQIKLITNNLDRIGMNKCAILLNVSMPTLCRLLKDYKISKPKNVRYKWPSHRIKNQQFGRLTIIDYADNQDNKNRMVIVKCECGTIKETHLSPILDGRTVSCGCFHLEQCAQTLRNYNKTHVGKTGKESSHFTGLDFISGTFFGQMKKSAQHRNLKFNITIEYVRDLFLKQNGKCALSDVELQFSSRAKASDGTASLDRIDSSKGYIEGNVQWVHQSINYMKQDFDQDYFIEMCHKVAETHPKL